MRIAIVFAVMGLARAASAECAAVPTRISPESGAIVPADPILYVWRSPWNDGAITADVPISVEPLNDQVVRVHVTATRAFTIAIGEESWRYTVGKTPPDRAMLIAGEAIASAWTCSYTRVVQLDVIGNAIAYRLELADDVTALRSGDAQVAYLRPRLEAPYLRDRGAADTIQIGHVDCQGWSAPEDTLARGAYVKLTAIFADGRERGEELGWMQLNDRRIRAPDWYDSPLALAP